MDAYHLIEDKIRYNQWANRSIVEWLKKQSGPLHNRHITSSFPSLNKVLHHMLEAETYYLSILKGSKEVYYDDLLTEQIFEGLLSINKELLNWFRSQPFDIVEKVMVLKRSPYEERYTVGTLITHVVNHGTYHRGQIIALRHQLEISDPPKTDYYWMFAQELLAKGKSSHGS